MAHNLPSRLTSFVGREREIAEIGAFVRRERLITLVGAPGVGKTRLALQSAFGVLDVFSDGTWQVELAPLADPELVPHAVAAVLGVREQPGRTLTETLAGYLRTRRLLLLLDNCEHLIGAVAELVETLLHACPDLHVLATSREPLAIEGERVHRVPTLPDDEATRLFAERARVASPSFALTERTAPIVSRVCARLDGIPLAIELAAARVRALSLEQIAARLDDRFRLLTGGSRTALPRQQTLRGAVDWSYDLLSAPEQTLLRRLAVFAGGFTLDAAEYVGNHASQPVDLLVSLVDKSLVQVDDADGEDAERRWRLLETFRQYGEEKLIEHGEFEEARNRHRDYVLAFVETLAPHLNVRPDSMMLNRVEREHDNLRAALNWCLEKASRQASDRLPALTDPPRDAELGARLAGSIWRFWWLRGHVGEGRGWLTRVLAMPASATSLVGLAVRARALQGLANLSTYQGDYRAAVPHMTDALTLSREAGDDRGVVVALHRLGYYLAHLGESERPTRLCEESVALARRVDDPFSLALALQTSGSVARMLGRAEQAVLPLEEAISLFRQIGNVINVAYALRGLSYAVEDLGDSVRALALSEEGLRISREVGDKRGMAESFKNLGRHALFAGDVEHAMEPLRMAFALLQPLGDGWLTSICLEILAGVKTLQGTQTPSPDATSPVQSDSVAEHHLDAVRLYAWAELLRTQSGLDPPPEMRGDPERNLALLRECLGEAVFSQAQAEGRAMSFDEVVEYALALTAPAAPPASGAPSGAPDSLNLTPREREVAALIVQGSTNREIAEALVLSERTVDSHVRNVMAKLETSSRARIAAWAVQHGLGAPR